MLDLVDDGAEDDCGDDNDVMAMLLTGISEALLGEWAGAPLRS